MLKKNQKLSYISSHTYLIYDDIINMTHRWLISCFSGWKKIIEDLLSLPCLRHGQSRKCACQDCLRWYRFPTIQHPRATSIKSTVWYGYDQYDSAVRFHVFVFFSSSQVLFLSLLCFTLFHPGLSPVTGARGPSPSHQSGKARHSRKNQWQTGTTQLSDKRMMG